MWRGRQRSRPIDLAAAQRRLVSIGEQFAAERGFDDDDADDAARSAEPAASPEATYAGRHLAGPLRVTWAASTRPGRAYLVLAALVATIAVLVSVWVVIRSTSHPTEMTLTTAQVTPPGAGSSAPASSAAVPAGQLTSGPAATSRVAPTGSAGAAAGQQVVVDVTGKVRRPGIVELPVGSRVVDALKAAGGARDGVDLASVNLARVLVDGEQIVIGYRVPTVPGASASTPPATAQPQPVNLNTATEPQLEALPGIGPVTAAAILQYRTEHGPFGSVDQLLDVSGIGDVTLSNLRPYVVV
jgi:competence protein ComEA